MNVPNLLTLFRFALVPIYLGIFFFQFSGRVYWALGIILLAGLTDVIDGYIARKYEQVTELGIMLDPLADKCMVLAVFFSLLLSGLIGPLAGGMIFLREIAMIVCSAFFHFQGKKTVPANLLGKLTTFLFYITLVLLMLRVNGAEYLLWIWIALSYIASLVYIFQFRSINEAS